MPSCVQEIDQLIAEWKPEPLVEARTAVDVAPPIITRSVQFRCDSRMRVQCPGHTEYLSLQASFDIASILHL